MATVTYNGKSISPPPFVSRQFEPLNYGDRWGFTQSIQLDGWITGKITGIGILGTGILGTGFLFKKSGLLDIFSQNFKELLVSGEHHEHIKIPICHVEEISFENNPYHITPFGAIPYSVKIKTFNVPSGVVDVSNEYSFTENNDNTVSVTHKIAAKGIRGNSIAIANAINFVKLFTGKNPYSNCLPAFVGTGSGIILSISENIDRLAGTVSVTENYKYNPITGSDTPKTYVETATLSLTEGKTQDYTSYDLNVEFLGSPINSSLGVLRFESGTPNKGLSGYNPYLKLLEYGIDSGNCYLNTTSINEDSGKNSVSFKASFLSGNSGDFDGFFDYQINVSCDEINDLKTYNLNGQFIVKGPANHRRERVSGFKNRVLSSGHIGGQMHRYLHHLITGSEIASGFKGTGTRVIHPLPISFSISENTGVGTFSMNASFNDRDFVDYANNVEYTISVTPERWLFNLYPAANIEGHFIIQDLQCKTRERIKVQINAQNTGNFDSCYTGLVEPLKPGSPQQPPSLIDRLFNTTLSGASPYYFVASGVNSGIFSVEVNKEVICQNSLGFRADATATFAQQLAAAADAARYPLIEGSGNKFASSIIEVEATFDKFGTVTKVPQPRRLPGYQFGY